MKTNYKIVAVSDLFDVTSSKRVFKSEWTQTGVPFYRAREIVKLSKNGFVNNELYISEEMYREYKTKYGAPQKGDILITGVGTIGVTYLVNSDKEFYFKDGNIIWLKKKADVCSRYIQYAFNTNYVKNQIAATSDGATVGTYTITNANSTLIPLPPLPVQERIAAILDAADTLRQKDQALLKKYDDLSQSVFLDMFGDPVTNPKGWDMLRLDEFCEFENGDRSSNYPSGNDIKGHGKLFLSSGDMKNGRFIVKDSKFISTEKFLSLKRGKCYRNDVLMTLRGNGTGKSAIFDCEYDEGFINAQMVILRPSLICNSNYLVYQLINPMIFKRLINLISGSAQPQLSAKSVKEFSVFVPPIKYQELFTSIIQAIHGQKQQVQVNIKKSEDLFQSLLQKAFKGELVDELEVNLLNG